MRSDVKGSQRMRGGLIFLNIFRASLFNKDLSNESNFGLIHLAGQYLRYLSSLFLPLSRRIDASAERLLQ
jgi:hypothetical protein